MLDPLDIDGVKPKLKNATLEELFCHELWYNGELYEPANVIYLKINSKWLRHYFDCGIIFWRTDTEAPTNYKAKELNSYFHIVDLGKKYNVRGKEIDSYTHRAILDGAETEFVFKNSFKLTFFNINDITKYRT